LADVLAFSAERASLPLVEISSSNGNEEQA
jgi:hypothetical protein